MDVRNILSILQVEIGRDLEFVVRHVSGKFYDRKAITTVPLHQYGDFLCSIHRLHVRPCTWRTSVVDVLSNGVRVRHPLRVEPTSITPSESMKEVPVCARPTKTTTEFNWSSCAVHLLDMTKEAHLYIKREMPVGFPSI